ncbi:MAG: metallophosphoesterase, partial [Bacteroidia bacterium]
PFSILKIICKDNTEKLFFDAKNHELFSIVSDDEQYVINDIDNQEEIDGAIAFYDKVTTDKFMEGVVIKPEIVYNKGIVPFLKCRNVNYLTLVYGYDFNDEIKYQKLVKNKGVRNKMNTSIKEFEIGKKMLESSYSSISLENNEYLAKAIQMIEEQEREIYLDPRL